MRTLVTGAAGFIGSTLVDRLLEEGHQVTGVDNLIASSRAAHLESVHRPSRPRHYTFVAADVRHPALADIVEGSNPDVVFHLAGQVDVGKSVDDPQNDARSNVLGTINLLEASRRARVPRIIYAASGDSRYGAPTTLPATEDTAVHPLSPYAAAKLAGEFYMHAYAEMYGLAPICLALANVYGPRQDPHGRAGSVVTIFGSAMISGRLTTIYGDGSDTRDYVYVDDVVTAFLCAADAPLTTTGTINIGTGVQTTVTELHQLIAATVGVSRPPDYVEARTGDIHASALDPSRAGRVLGWKPDTNLSEGVKRTVEWLREIINPDTAQLARA